MPGHVPLQAPLVQCFWAWLWLHHAIFSLYIAQFARPPLDMKLERCWRRYCCCCCWGGGHGVLPPGAAPDAPKVFSQPWSPTIFLPRRAVFQNVSCAGHITTCALALTATPCAVIDDPAATGSVTLSSTERQGAVIVLGAPASCVARCCSSKFLYRRIDRRVVCRSAACRACPIALGACATFQC